MKQSLIEEATGYFRAERLQLEKELTTKEKEHKEAVESLLRLPFVSLLKQPLKPFLKRLLPPKVKRLKREIADLEEKIGRCVQVEIDLGEGRYGSARLLLDEFLKSIPPGFPMISGLDGMSGGSIPNPMFYQALELRKELISLQEEK